MKRTISDPGHGSGETVRTQERPTADMTKVLVVARSPINRVVVAKIVEGSGLKTLCEGPDAAVAVLRSATPGTIILDGGNDNRDCDGLMASIMSLRQASGTNRPSVILLSNKPGTPESLALPSAIDVVVAKPITPERLQPVVDRLAGRA